MPDPATGGTREAWIACPRCKKERQLTPLRDEPDELWDARVKLAAVCVCTSCDMDAAIERNECPESIWFDEGWKSGITSCTLPWHHEGRCKPLVIPRSVYEHAWKVELERRASQDVGAERAPQISELGELQQ